MFLRCLRVRGIRLGWVVVVCLGFVFGWFVLVLLLVGFKECLYVK